MPGISDFIDMATKQLGVSNGAAQAGAGGLLSMLKDKVGGDLFGKVAAAIPGTRIRVNPDAAPDKRSYQVDFSLFQSIAPDHQPQTSLRKSIEELKSGIVRESGTKVALPEAEVTILPEDAEPIATTTDVGGRFELRGVPKGKHLVRVAHAGHEVFSTVEEFSDKELLEVRYFLPARSYNRFETIIRSNKATKEVSRVTLRREEVTAVAGTFGDPLRAIENLPSMARAPLIGGQLLVRGTSPRNTGVYIDGVQVPLLYHFGALTSVINPGFLETIDFYPGGFGAKYGRATAGIVDVKTRSLTMKNCRGYAEEDVFDSGFFYSCPITM